MVLLWNDQTKSVKIVSMMSTKHIGDIVEAGKVHFATKKQIKKTDAIVVYIRTMDGVDNMRHVPYVSVARKGGIK